MEATNYLKSFFTEHWKYMTVSTACKLNLFDALLHTHTIHELAEELSLEINKIHLLLDALVSVGFLSKRNNAFELNEISELLTENHPESLKYAALNWSGEHLTAWQHLDYTIKSGKSSFGYVFGKSFFDYINDHPTKLNNYHKAMYEYARDDYKQLPELVDFGKHESIMDVGGGYGAAISVIKNKYPHTNCILFDLEKVVAGAADTVEKIQGNFFESIPNGSDALILSRILHDWNNDCALQILQNCNNALPKEGSLYIIENCHENTTADLSLLSLNMALMCESFERSETEYIELCQNAGFSFDSSKQLNQLQTILIFKKQ